MITVKIEGRAREQLEYIKKNLHGKDLYKRIGVQVRDHYQSAFAKKGDIDGRKRWKQSSPLTTILRTRQSGKFTGDADVGTATANLNPLMDTSMLRNSITLEAYTGKVEVGTSMRGRENQYDRVIKFRFTPDMQAKFKRNVAATLPGRPAIKKEDIHHVDSIYKRMKFTARGWVGTGIKSRTVYRKVKTAHGGVRVIKAAKKNWNPYFFMMFNALKKKEARGSSVFVPKREYIFMSENLRQKIGGIIDAYYKQLFARNG